MKRKTFVLSGAAILACAGILSASTPKQSGEKNKDEKSKYKHIQVISMKDGKLTEIDTLIPMNSKYSVYNFLNDHQISSYKVEIIKIPPLEGIELHEFLEDGNDKKKKVIVKSDIRVEHIEGDDIKKESIENIQIIYKVDDNGNMTAKKIVNGKEVELTNEELESIHLTFHNPEDASDHKNVMIMINDMDLDGDSLRKKIMKKIQVEIRGNDLDFELGSELNKDSLMDIIQSETETLHKDLDDIKVVVKKFGDKNHKEDDKKVVIINDGKKVEWNSKDDNDVIFQSDSNEDFTIVIVTEDASRDEIKKSNHKIGSEANFSLYPNPSNGIFIVKSENTKKENTSIEVVDMKGKVVFQKNIGKVSGEFKLQIDLSKNEKGVYLVNLNQGKKKNTKRVILK